MAAMTTRFGRRSFRWRYDREAASALIEEDRAVDGVLVRTPDGRLAMRHARCVQAGDRIENRPISLNMAAPDDMPRCSMCGELIPWSR